MAVNSNKILDNIRYATTRLEVKKNDGSTLVGTGFFYSCTLPENKEALLLVTNKHLAENWIHLSFKLNKADEYGEPIFCDEVAFSLKNDGSHLCLSHPEVDLFSFAILPTIKAAEKDGTKLCYRKITDEFIPKEDNIKLISSIEDVLMVGYPDGMADETHNLPIVRRGITATDFKIDYDGKKEFIIDASIFKGSSGSPVFICNIGSYNNADGNLCLGNRVFFLGIQYRGEFSKYQNNIYIKDAGGSYVNTPDVLSAYFNDLGFCVKSECLWWFRDEIINQGWK